MVAGTIRGQRGLRRGLSVCVCGTILAVAIVVSSLATPANAERRVALVIGNAIYEAAPTLKNPVNDAGAVAGSLTRLGFEVTLQRDLDREALVDALAAFVALAQGADWAVIYFSGHGIEINGSNYLIPTDAKLERDTSVRFEAIALEDVLAAAVPASTLRLIILDACRDNPFRDKIARSSGTRSVGKGLARIEPDTGTLVAFAARDGQVALDGDGQNSPFTTALLQFLEEPGLEIDLLFRRVRAAVLQATGVQEPWTYGSMPPTRLFFAGPAEEPKIEAFLAASEVSNPLASPDAIGALLHTEAALTDANRQRAVGDPQLRERFEKATQLATEARRMARASDKALSDLTEAKGRDIVAFFSALAALSPFEMEWAEFRAKNPKLSYLPDIPVPEPAGYAVELAALKQALVDKEREAEKFRLEAGTRIEQLGSEISDLRQKADSLVQERDALAAKAQTSETDRESLRGEIGRLNARIANYVRDIEAFGARRTELETSLQEKERELAVLQARVNVVEGQLHCTYAKTEAARIIGWSAYGTAYGDVGVAKWSNESWNFEIAEGGDRLARPKPGDLIKARRYVHIRRCFPDVPYNIATAQLLNEEELPPRVTEDKDYVAKPNELYRVRYVTQIGGGRYWVALERPSKGFYVQIGAYSTEDAARIAFSSLQMRFPTLLSSKLPSIEPVSPPASETVSYRTRLAPPSADYESASQLCTSLKEAAADLGGVDCFVTLN